MHFTVHKNIKKNTLIFLSLFFVLFKNIYKFDDLHFFWGDTIVCISSVCDHIKVLQTGLDTEMHIQN